MNEGPTRAPYKDTKRLIFMSGGQRPGSGRKKKGSNVRVSLSVRVSPATMEALERVAQEDGISLGEAVDKAVLEGLPMEEPWMEPCPPEGEPFEAPVEEPVEVAMEEPVEVAVEEPIEAAPEKAAPIEFNAWAGHDMVQVQVTPLEAGVEEAIKAALDEGGSLKAVPLVKELKKAGKVKLKVTSIG